MKQKIIASLVAGVLTGVVAVGVAQAGQIQASSTSVAREVVTDDLQGLTAPAVAYRLIGDVDARSQPQTFQLQFTLDNGLFDNTGAGPDGLPTLIKNAFSVSDGLTNQLQNQVGTNGAQANGSTLFNADYEILAVGLSTDRRTIWATFKVYKSDNALIKQPIISFNAGINRVNASAPGTAPILPVPATARAKVVGLKSLVGDLVQEYEHGGVCQRVVRTGMSVQHYLGLLSDFVMANSTNADPDDHNRAGSTNSGTILTFPTNLLVVVEPSTGSARLDSTTAGQSFTSPTAPAANNTWKSASLISLGTVLLRQNATGYDADLTNPYVLSKLEGRAAATAPYTTAANGGHVEARSVKVVVSATEGFVVGGALRLTDASNCAAGGTAVDETVTAGNAAGPITVSWPATPGAIGDGAGAVINSGAMSGTDTPPLYLCYVAPTGGAAKQIPSSAFSAVATLVKSTNNAAFDGEQDNACGGPLFGLGGGIKIDVRNYATSRDATGWYSVVRLINPSETGTARVFGQIIEQDGKFGPYGQIATLAPRAVVNLTSAQIDAQLTRAPEAGAANGHNTVVDYGSNGATAPRLRIVATGVNTLRVQNYMVNPATGAIAEFSSSQGVDYEAPVDRVFPDGEAQAISQDARTGLNGQ